MKKKKQRKPATRAIVPVQPQVQVVSIPEAIEKVLILGDLSSLTPQDRVDYYKRVCDSLGLNPLTMPFSYILFKEYDSQTNAKLSLYANKSCTEQLRKIHGVSVVPPMRRSRTKDIVTVECDVRDKTGRTDTASGSVPLYKIKDGRRIDLDGKDLCNAEMKCETKAKRRATLSICGLAFMDESELDTMEIVGGVTPEGRIYQYQHASASHQIADAKISEREKQGQAAVSRTEALDARINELKKTMPIQQAVEQAEREDVERQNDALKWKKEAEHKADEAAKPNPKKEPPKPIETKWELTIDWQMDRNAPVLTGDVKELVVALGEIKLEWKGELWHAAAKDIPAIMQVAGKNGFAVKEIQPQSSSAGQHANPAPSAQGKGSGSTGPSASPESVVGTIERVEPSSDGKRAVVTFVKNTGGKAGWTCFDKDIYGILLKNLGKLAEVIIQTREKDGKTYKNLVGLKRVGSTEYEDGKIPVIQNKDREAGGKTLFG